MRRLLAVSLVLLVIACSSKPQPVTLATGCDGPDGACTRYLQATDNEGAPLERGSVIVPFTGPVRTAGKPEGLTFVTETFNFETRANDLKLVPVKALRLDQQNPSQLQIDIDGLLANGAALDLPDGIVQSGKGKNLGPITIKVKTAISPLDVAMASVVWEPSDKELFNFDSIKPAKGQKGEPQVRQELEARLRVRPGITDEQVNAVLGQYDDPATKKRIPDNRVRAGLLMLTGTSAEPAIPFILSDTNRRGAPFEPVEVRPLLQFGALAAVSYHPLIGKLQMFIDTEVAAGPLESIGIELAHEAVHSGLGGGNSTEETLAKAIQVRVWQEFLLWDASLATSPTPGIRTLNFETLALRNSGRFAFPRAGILPRPGVDDVLRGTGKQDPARSFKDLLTHPNVYGELPKAGNAATEVVEGYYQRIAGATASTGRIAMDNATLKQFDKIMDHGFSDEQILAILDALKLKPVALKPAAQ